MMIEIPDDAGSAFEALIAAFGARPTTHSDAPLIRDAIATFLVHQQRNTRRTYQTHLNRVRDGIAPICDQNCVPCSTPVRTQPLDEQGNTMPGRQYAFECQCECKACKQSRISLPPLGGLQVGPKTVCADTLRTLSQAALRTAIKSGNYDNARRARKQKPPKKADGFGAQETAIAAFRAFCNANRQWTGGYDGLDVDKPSRNSDGRRPLDPWEMIELAQVTELGGNDPELDALLVEFGIAVGARRLGAIELTVGQIDRPNQMIVLRDKNGKSIAQPVSIELIDQLLDHARSRGGNRCDPSHPDFDPRQRVFWVWHRQGATWAPITSRRFDSLAERWQADLSWAAADQLAYHHLRHTMAERLKTMTGGGHHVAQRYLRHADADVTDRYGRCSLDKLAECMSRLLRFEHPVVHGRVARRDEVLRMYGKMPEW